MKKFVNLFCFPKFYRNVTIENELIQTVSINAVILENKEQFEKTNQTVTLAMIQNSFEKFRTDIKTSSTKLFLYDSYPDNIFLNITETSVNLSTIKGKN
jgi:hypothetical protein